MATFTHKDIIGPAFYGAWNDFLDRKYSTMCLSGGRGSLKSSFVGIAIICGLERDAQEALIRKKAGDPKWKHYLTHAVCYRKVFGTCEQSVYSQLVWAIEKLGLTAEYECKKSPLKIIKRKTGQMILFRGLDDPLKSKSIKAPYSFFRYCWFEETAEFDGIEEIRNVKQSVQRGGHQFLTFFTYNPPETSANWVNFTMAELAAKDPTFHKYDSDYRAVPREWLGDQFFKEAELLASINYRAYCHEYLGQITGNGGSVFPNVRGVSVSDEDIRHFSNIHWGCDFGSVDPTVLIGMEYEKFNHRLIIFTEVYESNMLLDEMERRFKAAYFGHEYIMADCAARQMIMELENRGLNMMPCAKGADSILHGIKWLQNLREICIDVNRCPNTYKEFSLYEYEKDPHTGKFTSKFPDEMNHAIDSCLTPDTLVHTVGGLRKIADIEGKQGALYAFDEKSGKVVVAPYANVRVTRENAPVMRVTLQGGDAVECTYDHRILTDRGYVEAANLVVGSRVVTTGGICKVSYLDGLGVCDKVYDLEVPGLHNFAVNGGIIVHNCRYGVEDLSTGSGLF